LLQLALYAGFWGVYIFCGVFALRYLTQNGIVAIFWPPSGIALAALLLGGARYLPAVFLGAFFINYIADTQPQFALLLAATNLAEAAAAWWLLARVRKIDTRLRHARAYFALFSLGGVAAPFLGALLGSAIVTYYGLSAQGFWQNLQFWWIGDSLGVIIMTPLILIWRHLPQLPREWRWYVEATTGLALLIFVGVITFTGFDIAGLSQYGKAFVLFAFVTWSAVRFGRHATAFVIALLVLMILTGIVRGKGYFMTGDFAVTLMTMSIYLLTLSITGMALAIYLYEHHTLERELSLSTQKLEQIAGLAQVGGWEYEIDSQKLTLNKETLRIIEFPEDDPPDAQSGLKLLDEADIPAHLERGRLAVEHGIGWDVEYAMKSRTGRRLWVRSQAKPVVEEGRVVKIIGALQDLTDWRQAQQQLQKKELEFRRLVETASEGIWTIDTEGKTTFVNKRMADMLGYSPEEMLGKSFLDFVATDLHSTSLQKLAERNAGVSSVHESALVTRTGQTLWFMASTSPIRDENGNVIGALAMMTDITERKTVEDKLRQSEQRYRELVQSLAYGIVVHQSGFIVFANDAAAQMLQTQSAQDLVGRNVLDFVAPEFRAAVIDRMKQVNVPGGRVPVAEEKLIRLDGSEFIAEISATGILFDNKVATMVMLRDITDRVEAEEKVRFLSQHDALTGLPNRTLLFDRLQQAIALARRHQSAFAVLFLDLDNFKRINDSHGHRVGDLFLKEIAQRISQDLRAIDTVARQGGDEFIILLNELAHPEDAGSIAREICERLAAPVEVQGLLLQASGSIGIAVYPKDGDSAEILLRNADIAMYYAKGRGRNQYQFFSEELNRITQQRLEIEQALRKAITESQFYLVYQPQLNLQTGAVEGFEALIRWLHPVRGELSPLEFIPIAEESGQIAAVGEWVLRRVLSDIPRFDAAGHNHLRIAINVSAAQLRQENFANRVLSLLQEYSVQPLRIELEMTESILLQDIDAAAKAIQQLSAHGLRFAVDDFGTGYSSLSYLKALRIHHLKIDRSFISDLPYDADDAAIVRTIIALAQNLRLKVVAEGVETQEQRDFLRNHGCEMMQGFYLSCPLRLSAALQFLTDSMK